MFDKFPENLFVTSGISMLLYCFVVSLEVMIIIQINENIRTILDEQLLRETDNSSLLLCILLVAPENKSRAIS
jgi:hypothetical protein